MHYQHKTFVQQSSFYCVCYYAYHPVLELYVCWSSIGHLGPHAMVYEVNVLDGTCWGKTPYPAHILYQCYYTTYSILVKDRVSSLGTDCLLHANCINCIPQIIIIIINFPHTHTHCIQNERLWDAAEHGNITTSAMLLDAGADVNAISKYFVSEIVYTSSSIQTPFCSPIASL